MQCAHLSESHPLVTQFHAPDLRQSPRDQRHAGIPTGEHAADAFAVPGFAVLLQRSVGQRARTFGDIVCGGDDLAHGGDRFVVGDAHDVVSGLQDIRQRLLVRRFACYTFGDARLTGSFHELSLLKRNLIGWRVLGYDADDLRFVQAGSRDRHLIPCIKNQARSRLKIHPSPYANVQRTKNRYAKKRVVDKSLLRSTSQIPYLGDAPHTKEHGGKHT